MLFFKVKSKVLESGILIFAAYGRAISAKATDNDNILCWQDYRM